MSHYDTQNEQYLKEQNEPAKKICLIDCGTMKNPDYSHYEDQASENLLNAVLETNNKPYSPAPKPFVNANTAVKRLNKAFKKLEEKMQMKQQLKFTSDIALTHKQPEVDMLARIELDCPDKGLMVMDFTLKFETDTEYAGLDKDGYAAIVSKKEFIAFHTVDDRSELDIAKEKQVDEYVALLSKSCVVTHNGIVRLLQEKGLLAEIILPLKK